MNAIDAHCHAGPGDGLTDPWNTSAPLDAYLSRAAAAGIRRTIVWPAFHSDNRTSNEAVAALVRRTPQRLWGFAMLHAERDRGRIDALVDQAVVEYGFLGLKVHRGDAPLSREICEAARRWSLPVVYDVMGHVADAEMWAPAYPQVAFIVPHLGSYAGEWRAHQACVDVVARHPNVYTDTSGVQRFDYLVEVVRRAGVHKLVFGSDGPWHHPGVELEKVRALELAPAGEVRVTSGNILALTRRIRAWQAGRRDSGPRPRVPGQIHSPRRST